MYEFDGTPMNPMFLAYSPALMLPTQTMNPTKAASATSKAKRALSDSSDDDEYLGHIDGHPLPLNQHSEHLKRAMEPAHWVHRIDRDLVYWSAAGMLVFGGAAYLM